MRIDTGSDLLLADVRDGIGTVTFNDPARHNVLSGAMQAALVPVIRGWADDDDVRVVVMRGAGPRAFAAGADIGELAAPPPDARAVEHREPTAWTCWAALTKPVVAVIDGYCIGGGLLMALQADIRICSDRSTFAIPAARLGLGYGSAGVRAVMRVAGPAVAADLLFSARRLDAGEALVAGLVNRVVPAESLTATAATATAQIAANAPLTIRACKVAITNELELPAQRDDDAVERLVAACFASADFTEGRTAFLEKRDPVFRGR